MSAENAPERAAWVDDISVFRSSAFGARAGGDWCEAVPLSEHAVGLTVGDVSGHGTAVAGTMEAMRASVLLALRATRVPSEILSAANKVAAAWDGGTIVTAVVAILDYSRNTFAFANAGHPPPLLLTRDRHAFLEHPPADLPLGIIPRHCAADYVLTLPPDPLLILYTDGITEHARDPLRGEAELVAAARRVYDRRVQNPARTIARLVLKRTRGNDDAAAMALRPGRTTRSA